MICTCPLEAELFWVAVLYRGVDFVALGQGSVAYPLYGHYRYSMLSCNYLVLHLLCFGVSVVGPLVVVGVAGRVMGTFAL